MVHKEAWENLYASLTYFWDLYNGNTNINHKGLQRAANECAEERRIYKDLIRKNNNVDILNSPSRILQHCSILLAEFNMST